MQREKAYRDVMKKHGFPEFITNEVIYHGQEDSIVQEFLEQYKDLDGVFASGYTMAQKLYETALARGKKIPQELQIISYDGSFRQWSNNEPLTCVEQPIEAMARAVVKLLLDRIHHEEVPMRTVLNTTFVLGTTTK
jgi:LacI family sucrose operon transcriptional repressor